RFRQSVLAAAVTGRLTEEWREQTQMPLWLIKSIDDICSFQNGFAFKSSWFEEKGEYQVIKLANVKDGYLKLDAAPAYLSASISAEHLKFSPNKGDLLISMTGTRFKMDYGFVCEVIDSDKVLVNQRVGRVIPDPNFVNGRFLHIFLRSELFRNQFFKGETGGVNQGNVGSSHIKSCQIDLPAVEEQTEIVRRVEQLFTFADQIEQRVKDAQSRVNHLTQSILAKAFRGELTAEWREQNPDLISGENSAEALLDKIKAEQTVAKPAKRTRRRKPG
ncbi:MAG: type I restriction endonuclease subunit S, partial [Gammaproteobacteria bacterium]|nr:type I restriction endonuclease subunit S [Gammaproteobacteria bacterium]